MPQEIEIKFPVSNLRRLQGRLREAGFRLVTPSQHEVNTLYDLPGEKLRKRRELLRLRSYGKSWKLTHTSGGKAGRHSSRLELETGVTDGSKMDAILRSLGYSPTFRYEKFRAEWADGRGQVVVDKTPIGDFCEIEGSPRWIDQTAKKLGVNRTDYIMKNYATLFAEWKQATKRAATQMTFQAIKG